MVSINQLTPISITMKMVTQQHINITEPVYSIKQITRWLKSHTVFHKLWAKQKAKLLKLLIHTGFIFQEVININETFVGFAFEPFC